MLITCCLIFALVPSLVDGQIQTQGETDELSSFCESEGVVVIEAESTNSDLGKWESKTAALENKFCGDGFLEFTGNRPQTGPANSPLVYDFKIETAGRYHIHLRCARETIDGARTLPTIATFVWKVILKLDRMLARSMVKTRLWRC